MAPWAKTKFGAPMFEPEVFRKQVYCIEESTCDIVRTFRLPPQLFGARGIMPPFPPRYASESVGPQPIYLRNSQMLTATDLNWFQPDSDYYPLT